YRTPSGLGGRIKGPPDKWAIERKVTRHKKWCMGSTSAKLSLMSTLPSTWSEVVGLGEMLMSISRDLRAWSCWMLFISIKLVFRFGILWLMALTMAGIRDCMAEWV